MKKLSLLAAPLVAMLLMAAQPGTLPTTVYAPGAALTNRTVAYDGGFNSLPAVLLKNIVSPAFFESNSAGSGVLQAVSGIDGGVPPGVVFEERGSLTSATSPAFTTMNHLFANTPQCVCSISSGASSINVCQTGQDAGLAPQFGGGDAGPVTTVIIGTLAADGGTWNYDCVGY